MKNAAEFYQSHLDRVSRSFAFCIARLENPFRSWVGLTYLVCRVLDTVEDAPWRRRSEQLDHFDRFDRYLTQPNSLDATEAQEHWVRLFPEDLPDSEKALLRDSPLLFSDLHGFPERAKKVIQSMVGTMSAGMRHFSEKRDEGALRLAGLAEVNQYCFFVAGVVGETLTQLYHLLDTRTPLTREVLLNSHHFGLFLQKVNLLKDQAVDEVSGRFLVPSREEVWLSLGANARGAFAYLESIPVDAKGYRLFCAWSLFLGLASLPFIRKSEGDSLKLKISRHETEQLIGQLEMWIESPEELREVFQGLCQAAGLDLQVAAGSVNRVPEWLQRAYNGRLAEQDFQSLGVTA